MKSLSLHCLKNHAHHSWFTHPLAVVGHLFLFAVFFVAGLAKGQGVPPELQPVTWVLGSSGFVSSSGNQGGITKNGGGTTPTWDAGAVSSQRILRDGRVTFKAASASQAMVGLTLASANEGYLEIDFAIYLLATNTAQVYQNGVAGVSLGAYTATTEFGIRRSGSKIEYLKDGSVLHTSTVASTGILFVDCSIAKLNSVITSAQIATGDLDNDGMADAWEEEQLPPLHSWADVVNFRAEDDADLDLVSNKLEFQMGTAANDGLSRIEPVAWLRDAASQLNTTLTASAGGIKKIDLLDDPEDPADYNARALASQIIAEDGQMIFKIKPGTIVSVGLNTSNVMPAATSVTTDLEWSIVTSADGTFDINPNTTDISPADSLGTYTADTVFCIRRTAGQVRFLKDGVLLHTAVAPSSGILYPNVWLSSPTAELTLAYIDTGDMDDDGLPDVWERQFLKPDSGWNDLIAFSPLGNADGTVIINNQPVSTGDTNSNVEELGDGTSPIDPLSRAESVVWRSDLVNATAISESTLGGLKKNVTAPLNYSARAFGTEAILEDGIVCFQVSGNGVMSFGLNTSNVMPLAANGTINTAAIATPDLEWAFTTSATGTYTVKPNAAAVTPTTPLNTYDASTRFMIQRLGGVVRFFRNGVVVHTAAAKSSGPLYVNVWLSTQNQQLTLARVYTGDIDDDGLPDAWELSYLADNSGYSQLDAFKASGAGLASDPDGDGVENLDEYYDETNPLLPQLKSPFVLWKTNPTSYFALTGTWGAVKKNSAAAQGWNADAIASKLDAGNQLIPFALGQTARLTFTATPGSTLAMGFTAVDDNRAQTDLEYRIQLIPATTTVPAQASVWEGTGTTAKFALGAFDASTRFSIRRVARQIDYLKDGQVLYSSLIPTTQSLLVDSSFNNPNNTNSEITSARLYTGDVDEDGMPDEWELYYWKRSNPWSTLTFQVLQNSVRPQWDLDNDGATNFQEFCAGTDPVSNVSRLQSVKWLSPVNVTADPSIYQQGALTKNSTIAAGYNAGAVSEKALISDGSFIFSANPTGTAAIGLTAFNTSANNLDIEYSLVLSSAGNASVYEGNGSNSSVLKADLGSYTASTIFTIRRLGVTIEYLKNGVLAYTSATSSSAPLFADCSINTQGHFISMAKLCDRVQDNDNDGLPDEWEVSQIGLGANLESISDLIPEGDDDMDGVLNVDEYLNGTSINSTDSDGDGMPDRWELDNGLAATDPSNALADLDSDGLNNLGEYQNQTAVRNADTDSDGMWDGYEVLHRLPPFGLAPLNPSDADADKDGDLVPNLWEFMRTKPGTNPPAPYSASDPADTPAWDAFFDPSLASNLPAQHQFQNLQDAYKSLPLNTEYYGTLLMRKNVSSDEDLNTKYASTQQYPRKVAIVAEGGVEQSAFMEGVVIKDSSWILNGNVIVSGIVFDGTHIEIQTTPGSVTRVHFVNCLFRNCQVYRSSGDSDSSYGGALTNLGGEVSLTHCTFFRCSSYDENFTGIATIANLSGTLKFKNCLLWDDEYISSTPISGPVAGINIQNSLIQGGMLGSLDVTPALNDYGYLTAQSIDCLQGGSSSLVSRDILGQTRSASTPSIGAMEWIDSDNDRLPDWWERFWFLSLARAGDDVTHPFFPKILVGAFTPPRYRDKTALDHYLDFTEPTVSYDGDNLVDTWEMFYFQNLLQGDDGNPDGDARSNLQEQAEGTDPTIKDNDFDSEPDGLPDVWEETHFTHFPSILQPPLSPLRFIGSGEPKELADPDFDGWTNLEEFEKRTDPTVADVPKDRDIDSNNDGIMDTGDGVPDAWERYYFSSELLWAAADDPDGDDISNLNEYIAGTHPDQKPYLFDKNNNRLWDWWEVRHFGSLQVASFWSGDADGDGRSNEREMLEGTDPNDNADFKIPPGNLGDFSLVEPLPKPFNTDELTYCFEGVVTTRGNGASWIRETGDQGWGVFKLIPRHFNGSYFTSYLRTPGVSYYSGWINKEKYSYDNPWSEGIYYPEGGQLAYNSEEIFNGRMYTELTNGRYEPADRLIIKAFKRQRDQWTEVYQIKPGRTHAEGNSIIVRGHGRNVSRGGGYYPKFNRHEAGHIDNRGGWVHAFYNRESHESLYEVPLHIPRVLPPTDIAGPRYRKIGLNGVPMPDSVPGKQNDDSTLPEETFADAYSRQLRHSTSDVWSQRSSSDLPLQIRRDLTPEVWSWRSGLKPEERPDRPFGPCWTSNLTPHIRLEISANTSDEWHNWYYNTVGSNGNYSPRTINPYDADARPLTNNNDRLTDKMKNPPRITLMDERGASYSFTDLGGVSLPNNAIGHYAAWVHSPDERHDVKTAWDTLTQSPPGLASEADSFILRKRNGTECHYEKCELQQTMPNDRLRPTCIKVDYSYFRMTFVMTAQGNKLEYRYSGNSLIPDKVFDPDMEKAPPASPNSPSAGAIIISQDQGRVTQIQGPSGETVYYHYSNPLGSFDPKEHQLDKDFMGSDNSNNKYPMLVSVTRETRAGVVAPVVHQSVGYEYSYAYEVDKTPDETVPGVQTYGHLELARLTDERGNDHEFRYRQHDGHKYDIWNGAFTFTRTQAGLPRLLTSITRPDDSVVSFSGSRDVHLRLGGTITGNGILTTVSGPAGTYSYKFHDPFVERPNELTFNTNYFTGNLPDGDINEGLIYLYFRQMDITSAAGVEKYSFLPEACMALHKVTDLSGNTTTYEYGEKVVGTGARKIRTITINPNTNMFEQNVLDVYYDDPIAEISASVLLGEPRDPFQKHPAVNGNYEGRKEYDYHPTFRTRIAATDEMGIKSLTTLNEITGLPEKEEVIDTRGTAAIGDDLILRRTTYSYTPPSSFTPAHDFKSFLYRKTITTQGFQTPGGFQAPTEAPRAPALEMVTDYLPDANGRVWKEIHYAGPHDNPDPQISKPLVTTTIYSSGGQKLIVTDPRSNQTRFHYHPQTLRLELTEFPGGTSKTIEYDAHGNVVKETDETGYVTLHEYDKFNRKTKTAIDLNTAGAPNGNGLIDANYTAVTLPAANNPAPPTFNGDIVTITTYNAFNLPVTITDPRGVVTRHDYDAIGRLIKTTVNATGPIAERQVTRYGDHGPDGLNTDITNDFVGGSIFDTKGFKPLQVTDPRGFVTTFTYDKVYRQTSQTLTDTTYEVGHLARTVSNYTLYDDAGRPVHQIDALGRATTTDYDALGQPVTIHHPSDAVTPPSAKHTFYTPAGQVWRTVDEIGAETLTYHDHAGRPTHVIGAEVPVLNPTTGQITLQRPVTITQYDAAGNPTHVTDPLGRSTETQYDARNRARYVITPEVLNVVSPTVAPVLVRPVAETRYDAAGRVITVIDPLGAETHTHYDRAGRAYRVIAPQTGAQTHITRNKMDPGGCILQVIDAKNQTVTNVYDAFKRLEQTTDHNQVTNTFGYDHAGNRTSVKDGLNQETLFTYDAQNRLKTQRFANLKVLTFHYNAIQKTSQVDAASRTTSYGYDARDRLRTVNSEDLSRVQTYDKAGRLLTVTESTNAQASVTQTYSALGWLMSETSSGVTHVYGYDLTGTRIHAAYGSGRTISTTFDNLNRPLTITEGGRTTTYGYDLAGRAVSLLSGNGNFCWNVYDLQGRLKERTLYADATLQTKLTELLWDYDALGSVLSHHEKWPGSPLRAAGWRVTTMTYDASNRLHMETVSHSETQMIHTVYTYDAAHNRQTKTVLGGDEPGFWDYNYNGANQLRTWQKYDEEGGTLLKNALLVYDDDGNRASQAISEASSTQTTFYQWDAQNRLLGVTMPDSTQHYYAYDYRTRRIRTARTGGGQAAKATTIAFAGGLSIAEWEAEAAEPSTANAPTVEYTRGPDMGGGVGGLLYTVRGSTPKFNLSNGRGDIIAQSNALGALTWTASYEAYGKRTKETGTNEDKQRANSKDEDPTGLLNEGFRYRDLETGVWLSRDPAGFVDGPNLYAYVQQNPWSKFDPAGLFWSALVTAGFAAYDTFQYATGQMSGAEYARNMAVNGAALAADVLTAGQGGGFAVRAAALSCRAKTVIVAGCRAVEKADNIAATMESAAGAAEQMAKGNYGQAAAQIASAALTGKSSMSKMDVPSFCFMAGTRVQTHRGLEKIESLRVGGRVLADESAAVKPTAVRAGEWRRVEFTFADPHSREGKPCRVVLLRSAGHVAQRGWRAGAEVKIDFGEEVQRAEGRARIVSITAADAPEVGAGQVVTGTFQTWHRDLRELWMEGLKTPVRVTSGHRFYSASREAWVEAHHLRVGETVRTRDGAGCRVRVVLPLPGEHEVFNIEVETAHQYHVTTAGLLTHNNTPNCTTSNSANGTARTNEAASESTSQWDAISDQASLDGANTRSTTTRMPSELAALRNEFDTDVRSTFLKVRAENLSPSEARRLSSEDIMDMKAGEVPEGWNVHHMQPLSRHGDNSFGNLRLMKESFHEKHSKKLHDYKDGENPYGRD